MLIRVLFWFIVFYSLFKLLIRVVLPMLSATKIVRSKMKDMRQNMAEFEGSRHTSPSGSETFTQKEATSSSKGDYIDFEEIK